MPERKKESEVAQSHPTLCDPMDCSLPGSSVHGIFQARVLEWVAISSSWGSSQPRDRTWIRQRLYRLSHQGSYSLTHHKVAQWQSSTPLGFLLDLNGCLQSHMDFPGGSDSKASVYNVGDLGSIPGLGRSAGEGNGNPLQYYCLENPMDRGAWQATVHWVAKSRT